MRFPIIKVKDRTNGREHIVGTNVHDELDIDGGKTISYYNLQNGEGTGEFGDYCFVGHDNGDMRVVVEMVTFEELKEIYVKQTKEDEEAERKRQELIRKLLKED